MLPADKATLQRIGLRLRDLRVERAMTQDQVAGRAGFTAKYLSEIERGTRDLPLSTLRALVEQGLGVSFDAFFTPGTMKRPRVAPTSLPRDVETISALISELPTQLRRRLASLVQAVVAATKRRRSR